MGHRGLDPCRRETWEVGHYHEHRENSGQRARIPPPLNTQAGIELDQLLKQIRQEMAVQHHFADGTCEGLAEDGRDASE